MRITRYTDYALRVLIQLALQPRRLTIADMARAYGISRHHLTKVVHQLQRLGYVETQRGQTGGVRLARSAADIRVGKVVRDMEPDLALVECFHGEDRCAITPYCQLRVVFEQGLRRFLETLDGYTLEDMVRGERRQLIRILEPPSFG